jgi:Domain of unknown function (DUF3576).|tara:strand:- start:413 stop:985 length:573 start_codon:yes stop_codon:yes gene_type:complete
MIRKIFPLLLFFSLITFFLSGCGIYKRSDVKDNPVEVDKRVQKNIEEGKGIRFNVGGKKNSGVFDFASSNEMWRATIETLDFVSFTNASYSGGIIITDWFSGNAGDDKREMKITVRFLSNEIRAEGIEVTIHERICDENKINCKIVRKKSKLENEIKLAILKKAARIQNNKIDKKAKKRKKLPRLPKETN